VGCLTHSLSIVHYLKSKFWKKGKKKKRWNARPLNIVWRVQLCHQLVPSAKNCPYIMDMVTDRNITCWWATTHREKSNFIQLSLSHELSKLLLSSKQSTMRTCGLGQPALWMRTTVDHRDNPRKSRTLHCCDVSYFTACLCHQCHTPTDSTGPAKVTSDVLWRKTCWFCEFFVNRISYDFSLNCSLTF
jgi:hypothetical protein